MTDHYRAVISFQLTIWVIILGGLWIYWKANQPTPLIAGLFLSGLFSIFNTIKVMNGKPYRHISIFKFRGKNDKTN